MIEFALVMPILMLLLVVIFDLGFAAYSLLQVRAAADAGAQYASNHTWDTSAITAIVTGATGMDGISAEPAPGTVCGCPDGGTFTQADCAATCPSGSRPGVYAAISAQTEYQAVLPYPGFPTPLILSARAYRRLN